MVSASSGSSGKPFYWPRGDEQEIRGGKLHEKIFRDIFNIKNQRTLVVVCFSMGNWIAGTFTAASCRYVAKQKGIKLSIITPGIEKEDILAVLRDLAPEFETVILAGYPPFLMDIVTESKTREISLEKFNLKLLFAGEGFSERWRELICSSVNIKNSLLDTVSVYGTADAGALGHENPLTIFLRKKATENIGFRDELFGDIGFIPSLVQFDPDFIYFELINEQLAFTTDSGIPLIRYDIKDKGSIINQNELVLILKKFGFYEEAKNLLKKWRYPMVALFGRSDVAVTFYALNIYPENIKAAIEQSNLLSKLTGKFIARVETNEDQTLQKLIINFETLENVFVDDNLVGDTKRLVFENLTRLNTEYRKLHNAIGDRALPEIEFSSFGDELFKLRKNKQSWIKKQ
jgi:phenylacetate-CoA ligase